MFTWVKNLFKCSLFSGSRLPSPISPVWLSAVAFLLTQPQARGCFKADSSSGWLTSLCTAAWPAGGKNCILELEEVIWKMTLNLRRIMRTCSVHCCRPFFFLSVWAFIWCECVYVLDLMCVACMCSLSASASARCGSCGLWGSVGGWWVWKLGVYHVRGIAAVSCWLHASSRFTGGFLQNLQYMEQCTCVKGVFSYK